MELDKALILRLVNCSLEKLLYWILLAYEVGLWKPGLDRYRKALMYSLKISVQEKMLKAVMAAKVVLSLLGKYKADRYYELMKAVPSEIQLGGGFPGKSLSYVEASFPLVKKISSIHKMKLWP
jgi:hypothetical protein